MAYKPINSDLQVFNVLNYGAIADGATDNTTAFNNTLLALINAGGGIFYLPAGTYRTNTPIVMPSSAGNSASGTIHIHGDGQKATYLQFNPTTTSYPPGTGSSLTPTGYLGCIDVRGLGFAEVSNLTLANVNNSSSLPAIFIGQTVVHIHDFSIQAYGNTPMYAGIILGGTGANNGTTGYNQAFGGYIPIIENCYFDGVAIGVLGQASCNGAVIRDNFFHGFMPVTGFGLYTGAICLMGQEEASLCQYNKIINNTIELNNNWAYGIYLDFSCFNLIEGNAMDDTSLTASGGIFYTKNTFGNKDANNYYAHGTYGTLYTDLGGPAAFGGNVTFCINQHDEPALWGGVVNNQSNYSQQTSSYQLSINDGTINISGSSKTVTLPNLTGMSQSGYTGFNANGYIAPGYRYTVINTFNGAATLSASAGQLINNAPSYSLTGQYTAVTVVNDGTGWWIVSKI